MTAGFHETSSPGVFALVEETMEWSSESSSEVSFTIEIAPPKNASLLRKVVDPTKLWHSTMNATHPLEGVSGAWRHGSDEGRREQREHSVPGRDDPSIHTILVEPFDSITPRPAGPLGYRAWASRYRASIDIMPALSSMGPRILAMNVKQPVKALGNDDERWQGEGDIIAPRAHSRHHASRRV